MLSNSPQISVKGQIMINSNLLQNPASGNPSNQSSVSSAKFPILVVSDPNILLEVASVGNMSLMLYGDVAPANAQLYLTHDSETAEIEIRKYGIVDPTCRVFGFSQPLSRLLNESSSKEIFTRILDYSVTYAEWCKSQDAKELIIKEAVAIAKLSWENLTGAALKAELETLRTRCKMTSYDWNKLMIDLELEFKQELSRRGITYAPALDEAELLKLEIKLLATEKDEAKKAIITRELRKKGISNQDIRAIADQLSIDFETAKARYFSSYDLLNHEPEIAPWLIPGLLPSTGVAILAGDSGIGKSTLAYDCAYSVISGEPFLGETPARTGNVLFLTGDEPFDQLREKIITRGFFAHMGMFDVIHDWDITQDEILEEKLDQLRPVMVVIDSFSSIHQSENFDENSSHAARGIRKLNRLLERYNCAAVMIHHTGKSKENKGVHKLRGNSGIAAAATAVWLLSGEGSVRRFTTPKLRSAEAVDWNLTLDTHIGRFSVISGNEEIELSKSVIGRVRELFERLGHNTRLEFVEVKAEVSGSDDAIRKSLTRLCNQGILVKAPSKIDSRKIVYHLSSKYILPTPLHTDSINLSNKIIEQCTVHSVEVVDTALDTALDNIRENEEQIPIITPCLTIETPAGQGFAEVAGQPMTIEVGGGVTEDSGQVAIITEPIENIPAKQLQTGDRISCHTSEAAADKGWKTTAIVTEVEYQHGFLVECKIRYNDKKRGTVEATIPGGCADWILRKF